jgi:VanZ family protein
VLSVDELIYRWRIKLTVFSVGVILAVTLFPYVFFFNQAARSLYDASLVSYGGRKHVAPATDRQSIRGEEPEDWLDFPANMVLFVPLGFGLACLTTKRGLGKLSAILVILTAGFCLSLGIEILQIFLPSRFSSVSDILVNVLGTFVGLLFFRLWRFQILEWVLILRQKTRQFLTIKVLTASGLAYVALTFLMSITLQQATSFANWDDTFPFFWATSRAETDRGVGTLLSCKSPIEQSQQTR